MHAASATERWKVVVLVALGVMAVMAVTAAVAPGAALASCTSPVNEIEAENCLPGSTGWDVSGAGSSDIQGYATDISVNQSQRVQFKVDTNASDYRLDIYRMGYYSGLGARKVATVQPSVPLPQSQPSCTTDADGLVKCSNWAVSAHWDVPGTAVSGIYFAALVREDGTAGASHVFFVVRDDDGASGLLFQTSDTTWQAYNAYGGRSLYTGGPGSGPSRAYKVSYDRPFTTRGNAREDWVFNAEYPMVRWLERNAYDVSYITGVDSDRFGNLLRAGHQVFLSVGHDEYWSGTQRANVEAARNAGVDLAFFSGNEVFWKTRWEDNHRTLVSYKETHETSSIDPDATTWTGTWRDPRPFNPQGGRPENALTGTAFTVNAGTTEIRVPPTDGRLRLWRNSEVASQAAAGATSVLGDDTLGYEWDEDLDNGARPAGLVRLSSTTVEGVDKLQDHGSTYDTGTATHNLTLYRDTNGAAPDALVFGGGTVQWAWGLDGSHDRGSTITSAAIQQATVNLFADMGPRPGALQPGLSPAAASTDATPPTTRITSPAAGAVPGGRVTIRGTAADAGGRVGGVEVSTDGGATWHPAAGRESWSYEWTPSATGETTLLSRAADDSANLGAPSAPVRVDVGGRNCPCTLFGDAFSGGAASDTQAIELGTRFRPSVDGFVTALRYYRASSAMANPVGHLWTSTGTRLAEVAFTGSGTGWQRAVLPTRVAVQAGTTYVVSYYAAAGRYAAAENFFASALDTPPLHAPAGAGVFVYATGGGFPTSAFAASNYWADVEFVRAGGNPPPGSGGGGSSGGGSSGGGGSSTGGGVVVKPTSQPAPRARVKPRRVTVSREGMVRLRVTCPGGEIGCKVLLRLRRNGTTIVSRRFVVTGGGPRTIRLYLNRSVRRKLARKGVLGVTAVASVPDRAGHRTVTRTRIRLLASRGRRR